MPEETLKGWRWPQLVVLGDGNTGKSSVLCRFAQFDFSAISDGVCTRRPVRLQLRPMSTKNRERIYDPSVRPDGHFSSFAVISSYQADKSLWRRSR